MDIKDVKEEMLKIEFIIADIIKQFEQKTETKVNAIIVNNSIQKPYGEIYKSVTIGLDIN